MVVQLDTRRGMDDPMPSYEALARTVVAGVVRYRLEHETNNITLAAGYGENHKCYNCGGQETTSRGSARKSARSARPTSAGHRRESLTSARATRRRCRPTTRRRTTSGSPSRRSCTLSLWPPTPAAAEEGGGGDLDAHRRVCGEVSRAAEATSTAANRSGKLLPHEACMAREQWN